MPNTSMDSYREVKERLDQIVDAVSADDLPLDDALALYEEAVKLGLRASDLIEQDTEAHDLEEEAAEEGAPGSAEGSAEQETAVQEAGAQGGQGL